MSEPYTVLIVDDHAVVRRGIRALLEAEGDCVVVGEASSGGEAVLLATDLVPDVVLNVAARLVQELKGASQETSMLYQTLSQHRCNAPQKRAHLQRQMYGLMMC